MTTTTDSFISEKLLTNEYLIKEYVNSKRSPEENAEECGCLRQTIIKKLMRFKIPIRGRIHVNEEFFSKWSPEMAYVLGVVCTDGNLQDAGVKDGRYKRRIVMLKNPWLGGKEAEVVTVASRSARKGLKRLSISQKEPELLEKVMRLMDCDAKLVYRNQQKYGDITSGEIYTFAISIERIYDDLILLGLTPRKSRTMKFPPVPDEYLRHFIRGCWDGDGSVSVYEDSSRTKTTRRLKASFTSGSLQFIQSMVKRLVRVGLRQRNIHRDGMRSYSIAFSDESCRAFYEYLYKDVNPDLFLARKYKLFSDFFGKLKNKNNEASNALDLLNE